MGCSIARYSTGFCVINLCTILGVQVVKEGEGLGKLLKERLYLVIFHEFEVLVF